MGTSFDGPRAELILVEARLISLAPIAAFTDMVMRKHLGSGWIDKARNEIGTYSPSALDDAVNVVDLDDAALLRIILKYWSPVFTSEGFRPRDRAQFETLLAARNASAHPTGRQLDTRVALAWLTSFAGTLDRIKQQDAASKVRELKKKMAPGTEEKTGDDVVEILQELRNRLVEDIQTEFTKKNDAGSRAGQLIVDRLARLEEGMISIDGKVDAITGRLGVQPRRAVESHAAQTSHEVTWSARRNPNGGYSVWATGPNHLPKFRLAFGQSELDKIVAGLAAAVDAARGRWYTVESAAAHEALHAEAMRRV